jgi:hypothetical protein
MKIKLLSAILTALMAISPLVAAADLGDYPSFLMKDHSLDSYVVVGSAAAPGDVVGAVDLAARLAGESYEVVSSGGATVTVTGGKSEDVPLGYPLGASGYLDTVFTDDDLAGLQDSAVTFQSDNYNFHDEIVLASSSPTVVASLNASEDDYGTGIYMEVASGALSYYYVFDEAINVSKATTAQPLTMEFLGKKMKITGTDATTPHTKFTAYVGDTYSMNIGDSVTVEGKTVTLENVGSTGSIRLTIDGTLFTVSGTETHDGVEITVDDFFYADALAERGATLIMGKQSSESYSDGDAYKKNDGICNDDPTDTDCWEWVINGLNANAAGDTGDDSDNTYPTIGVKSIFVVNDDTDNPVTTGGCYKYPNDYAEVCFDAVTVSDDSYMTLTFKYQDGVTLGTATDQKTVYITTSVEDGLQLESDSFGGTGYLSSDTRTNRIWLVWNTTMNGTSVWYRDSAGAKVLAGNITNDSTDTNIARVYYGNTKADNVEIDLTPRMTGGATAGNGYVNVTLDIEGKSTSDLVSGSDDIKMYWELVSQAFSNLGTSASTEEADELQAREGNTGVWSNVGTKDEDHRSNYGIIILNPKSNGASDEAEFQIPSEQVFATVSVKATGTTTTTGGDTVKKVVPVTNAVAKLDTEVNTPVGKHLVLVGGPAVNRLSATALGLTYPTYGSSGLLPFAEGEGYIALVDGVVETGKYAVVVAGWEAADTRDATSVLQQYDSFSEQLDGNMAVKVTGVSASGITAVTAEV